MTQPLSRRYQRRIPTPLRLRHFTPPHKQRRRTLQRIIVHEFRFADYTYKQCVHRTSVIEIRKPPKKVGIGGYKHVQ